MDLDSLDWQRGGVLHLKDRKLDVFFVTLQKSEDEYSPTTMYEDYLISHDLFHWQTQSNTSEQSSTGQRYLRHEEMGYTPLLFVRETKNLPSGLTATYHRASLAVWLFPVVWASEPARAGDETTYFFTQTQRIPHQDPPVDRLLAYVFTEWSRRARTTDFQSVGQVLQVDQWARRTGSPSYKAIKT